MGDRRQGVRRALWSWVLPSLLAAVLLYLSLRGVEWARVWSTIAAAQWRWIVVGALMTASSCFLRSLRWRLLLNASARFDVLTVFWATMSGYLGNNFLPARAGEVLRSFIISSQSSLTRTYVLTTALSERMMDAITLVLWSSVVLLEVHPKPAWMDRLSGTLAAGAVAGLAVVFILPRTGDLYRKVIGYLPLAEGLREKLTNFAGQILAGLAAFHDTRRFLAFAAFTAVVWCIDACTAMAVGRGLGIELSFGMASLLICGLGLGSALPSTPGYVGIFQFVAVSVLTPFGISKDGALAEVLILQAISYGVVLVFGLPGLYKFKGWRTAAVAAGE